MKCVRRAVNGIMLIWLLRSSVSCLYYVNFGYGWTNLVATMTTPSVVAAPTIITSDSLELVFALV